MDAPALPYELDTRLGGTSGTEVWSARKQGGGPKVALKLVRDADRAPLEAVRHELERAKGLEHPAIAQVLDFGESARGQFVASRLVDPAIALTALIAHHAVRRAVMPPAVVAQLGIALAEALEVARGLKVEGRRAPMLHLHLSPSNVLCARDGRVVLLDLGVPASRTAISPVSNAPVRGTPGYLAPEQVRGDAVDTRADVFALGALLHEAATLAPLFARPDPNASLRAILDDAPKALSDLVSGFPPALSRVIARALSKDPGDRQADPGELKASLKDAATTIPGFGEARSTLAGLVAAALAASAESTEELTEEHGPDEEPTGAILSPPQPMPAESVSIEQPAPALAALASGELGELPRAAPLREPSPAPALHDPPPAAPSELARAETTAGPVTRFSHVLEDPSRRRLIVLGLGATIVVLLALLLRGGPSGEADAELRAIFARGDYKGAEAYYRAHLSDFREPEPAFELAAESWSKQRPPPPPPPPSPSLRPAPDAPSLQDLTTLVAPADIPDPPAKTKAEKKARAKAKKSLAAALRFLEAGDLEMAARNLERSIAAADGPAARFHLGVIRAKRGELAQALANLSRYLELWPEAPDAKSLRVLLAALEPR